MKTRLDAATGLVGLGVALTLSGATILVPRGATARTAPAAVSAPSASTTAPPPTGGGGLMAAGLADDDDGNELLEHWGDPKFSHEERTQMAGLMAVFAAIGAGAYRRRVLLRRSYAGR